MNKIHQAINILMHFSHPDRKHFSGIPPKYTQLDQIGLCFCKFSTVLHRIRISIHTRAATSHSFSALLKLQKSQAYTFWQNSNPMLNYVLFPVYSLKQLWCRQCRQGQLGHSRETKNMNADRNLLLCNDYVLPRCQKSPPLQCDYFWKAFPFTKEME